MIRRFRPFLRGLSTTRTGTLGVALTTSSALLLVFMLLLQTAGVTGNSYAGLLTFLMLPGLFILGLILIPVGWAQLRRRTGKSTQELLTRSFPDDMIKADTFGSSLAVTIAGLTVVNLMVIGFGGAAILHHMDTPEFCGTTCHTVMNPEWVTYTSSPHAHVACVECHVGEGGKALIDAKLNGLRQMWLVTTGGYNRPIPTPVHTLRPARETCEKCHWPDKFYGDRIKSFMRFDADSASTARYSTLALKVGAGGQEGKIHWHVSAANEVRYQPVSDNHMQMAWVEVKRDGEYHRYVNRRAILPDADELPPMRTVDCVDCHNRATHVYQTPEDVVDELMAEGKIDRTVPWAKAASMQAITATVKSSDSREAAIAGALRGFYQRRDPSVLHRHLRGIDGMITELAAAHTRNVHPEMKVDWGNYPSHLGHRQGRAGCFRCHNNELVDSEGQSINADCTLCHSILAFDSPSPFRYLEPVQPAQPDSAMHIYLQQEFTGAR